MRGTPELLIPLAMMALVGTISFNFQVLLPLLADFTWHGTAATYAALTAAMGVGRSPARWPRARAGGCRPRLLVVVVARVRRRDAAGRGRADAGAADRGAGAARAPRA